VVIVGGFAVGPEGESFAQSSEAGWAARGGDGSGSFFATGTGAPPARVDLPGW
jgi:hypothetical protein